MINVVSGHAVYTASWTAARADVHSQQRFFCLMEEGEVIKMDTWQDIGSNPGEGVVLKTTGSVLSKSWNHESEGEKYFVKGDRRPVPPWIHTGQWLLRWPYVTQSSLHQVVFVYLCFCVLVSLYSSLTKSDQECSWCERTLHGPGWLWLRQLWKVLRSKLWRMLATIL